MDKEAADALIVEWRRLPYAHANWLAAKTGHYEDVDDLVGVAQIALVEAAYSYDETRGASFKTWALGNMRHRIQDYLRREMQDAGGRGAPRGQWYATRANDFVLDNNAEESSNDTFVGLNSYEEEGYAELEDLDLEISVLNGFLNWVEGRISDRDFDVLTVWMELGRLKVTGEQFGISEARVSQIVKVVLGLAKEYGQTVLQGDERG